MGELPVRQGKCILLVGLVLVEPAQMKFQPPRGKFCVPGEQYITDTPCCVCNGEKRKRWCGFHALFSAKNRRSSTRVKGKLRRRFEVSKARGAHHRRVERHNAIERERGRFAAAWIERGRGKSKARSVHLHTHTHNKDRRQRRWAQRRWVTTSPRCESTRMKPVSNRSSYCRLSRIEIQKNTHTSVHTELSKLRVK